MFNQNPVSVSVANLQPTPFGVPTAQPAAVPNMFQAAALQPSNMFSFAATTSAAQNPLFNFGQPQATFPMYTQAQQAPQALPAAQVAQLLQQPQAQVPTMTPDTELLLLHKATSAPEVFGDERDAIIAKLNRVQVARGFGTAYYSASHAPLRITANNPWYRFRTITYASIGVLSSPSAAGSSAPTPLDFYDTPPNNDTVVLAFDGPAGELLKTPSNQTAVMGVLADVFAQLQQRGAAPALHATIDGIRTLSDTRVELHLRVFMRDPSTAPPPAAVAPSFFGQPAQQPQAASQNFALRPAPVQQVADLLSKQDVVNYIQGKLNNTPLLIYPKFAVTDEMIKNYLSTPPAGTRRFGLR